MPRPVEIQINETGNAEQKISNISGGLSALGGAAIAASAVAVAAIGAIGIAATKAAIDFGTEAVNLAGDAIEMQSKFDVVFGDMAESAGQFFDQLAESTGRSRFALREMASSVQDTFVPLGFARDRATELSENLVALAIDVGSFNNVLAPDVMRDFQSALVGNHEAVRKYGIVISQVTLDQELMNMGIEDGVSGATELEKVQARLNLLYQGTTDAQGDAIRTADSWANSQVRLQSVIKDLQTEIGLRLIPVLTPLMERFGTLADDLAPKILAFMDSPQFQEFADTISDGLVRAFDALLPLLGEMGETLLPSLNEAMPHLINVFEGLINLLESPEFHVALNFVVDGLGKLIWISSELADILTNKSAPAIFQFSDILIYLYNRVQTAFIQLPYLLSNIGRDAIQGLIDGLWSKWQHLMDVANAIAQSVKNVISDALQIQSPSKVMYELGSLTAQGFYEGIQDEAQNQTNNFAPTININNPTVRNETDLRKIADMVQIELNKQSRIYRGGVISQTV